MFRNTIIYLSIFFSISLGMTIIQKPNVLISFQPSSHHILCKNRQPGDILWMTIRGITNLGQIVDTIDMAQATFDSSNLGLNADTCWIDSLAMNKTYDSTAGYLYELDNSAGFHYSLNHRFSFRARGAGSIPQFTDTVHSPLHDIQVTSPSSYETISRGQSLTVNWVVQNEDNVFVEITDNNINLLYFPLVDSGAYTISATSLDSLATGQIAVVVGREAFKIGLIGFPFIPIIAVSAIANYIPVEFQDAIGVQEPENRTQLSSISILRTNFGSNYIYYNQSKPSQLDLEIYNISGKKIREIKAQGQQNGTMYWDRKDENGNLVSKGIYIYRLKTADRNFFGKFVILK
jgi:hypothetical protein